MEFRVEGLGFAVYVVWKNGEKEPEELPRLWSLASCSPVV